MYNDEIIAAAGAIVRAAVAGNQSTLGERLAALRG